MGDNEKEEAANLVRLLCFNSIIAGLEIKWFNYTYVYCFQKEEFEWVLREEVHAILHQLHTVLVVSKNIFQNIIITIAMNLN